jgi:hypothetical protein
LTHFRSAKPLERIIKLTPAGRFGYEIRRLDRLGTHGPMAGIVIESSAVPLDGNVFNTVSLKAAG